MYNILEPHNILLFNCNIFVLLHSLQATNNLKSVGELCINNSNLRSMKLVEGSCGVNNKNWARRAACEMAAHAVNLNPDLQLSLENLFSLFVLMQFSIARNDVLSVAEEEH